MTWMYEYRLHPESAYPFRALVYNLETGWKRYNIQYPVLHCVTMRHPIMARSGIPAGCSHEMTLGLWRKI